MKDFLRLVRKFGWLPASQAFVFIISTLGFALLAHMLGPTQFARFASVILLFSVVSLVTDLSPQSYALVHGTTDEVIRTAKRLAIISGLLGLTLMLMAGLAASKLIPGGPLSRMELALLAVAMVGQVGMQVQRAVLVSVARYRSIAFCDTGSTLFGVIVALTLAVGPFANLALVGQLAATAIAKSAGIMLAARGLPQPTRTGTLTALWPAVRYGIRVVPLNVASYLGRSLDSGILPSLVPAAAAAGYARSYQVVVVPVTQLQLSLGPAILNRLSRHKRETGNSENPNSKLLWTWMSRIMFLAALAICAFAMLIEVVIFGPKWPMVHITIVAMAVCLPGIGMATYGSWSLQIDGSRRRTLAHFCTVVATPVAVVVAASLHSFVAAVATLVIVGGLAQPVLLSLIHIKSLSNRPAKVIMLVAAQWLILASIFYITACSSSFWTAPY